MAFVTCAWAAVPEFARLALHSDWAGTYVSGYELRVLFVHPPALFLRSSTYPARLTPRRATISFVKLILTDNWDKAVDLKSE
jgi:hypothetical protein